MVASQDKILGDIAIIYYRRTKQGVGGGGGGRQLPPKCALGKTKKLIRANISRNTLNFGHFISIFEWKVSGMYQARLARALMGAIFCFINRQGHQ
jgi:hypothetical protein